MSVLRLLFGFDGRIGRRPFLLALLATVASFLAGVYLGDLSLPLMASVLAPRGINAAFVLQGIWALLGFLAIWAAVALTAKRLRDLGRPIWWGAAAILPLVALAILNDALFLASKSISVPIFAQYAIFAAASALGIRVLVEGAITRGRDD
jgi:uncharacterized membrane protein YhaH (DUF805 family)